MECAFGGGGVVLERSWWAGFNGIYLVIFGFRMWERYWFLSDFFTETLLGHKTSLNLWNFLLTQQSRHLWQFFSSRRILPHEWLSNPANEVSSSWQLSLLTGEFIRWLNEHAPGDRQLEGFEWILDSPKS